MSFDGGPDEPIDDEEEEEEDLDLELKVPEPLEPPKPSKYKNYVEYFKVRTARPPRVRDADRKRQWRALRGRCIISYRVSVPPYRCSLFRGRRAFQVLFGSQG